MGRRIWLPNTAMCSLAYLSSSQKKKKKKGENLKLFLQEMESLYQAINEDKFEGPKDQRWKKKEIWFCDSG